MPAPACDTDAVEYPTMAYDFESDSSNDGEPPPLPEKTKFKAPARRNKRKAASAPPPADLPTFATLHNLYEYGRRNTELKKQLESSKRKIRELQRRFDEAQSLLLKRNDQIDEMQRVQAEEKQKLVQAQMGNMFDAIPSTLLPKRQRLCPSVSK